MLRFTLYKILYDYKQLSTKFISLKSNKILFNYGGYLFSLLAHVLGFRGIIIIIVINTKDE